MCLVCGNIADAQVASANMLTILVALSPLWGLYAYRALRWFSLETHSHRRYPVARLGILTASYAIIAYLAFASVMISFVISGAQWRSLFAWGMLFMAIIYFLLARSLNTALPLRKRDMAFIATVHSIGYFVLSLLFLLFASSVQHNPEFTSWFVGFGWMFTSQLTIIAPAFLVISVVLVRQAKQR